MQLLFGTMHDKLHFDMDIKENRLAHQLVLLSILLSKMYSMYCSFLSHRERFLSTPMCIAHGCMKVVRIISGLNWQHWDDIEYLYKLKQQTTYSKTFRTKCFAKIVLIPLQKLNRYMMVWIALKQRPQESILSCFGPPFLDTIQNWPT